MRATMKAASLLKPHAGGGAKLGSRAERREVYARFIAASISSVGLAQHAEFQKTRYPFLMRDRAIDKLEDLKRSVGVEMMQSYAEVRLVANPVPLEAAGRVMADLDLVFRCVDRSQREMDAALDRLARAQDTFIQASRDDLWYLPRWWQVWRPAWWGARWRAVRGPKRIVLGTEGQWSPPS